MAKKEIEILRTGTHISNSGDSYTFTHEDLQEVVDSYDPQNFRAPLIVSHDTKGIDDKKLPDSQLAYGTPKYLKKVGDRVRAVFDQISPTFVDWVKNKQILGISPSLYLKNSPNNPTPGKLSLRHIAGLGVDPPAIKGLAPLSLSELVNYSAQDTQAARAALEKAWALPIANFSNPEPVGVASFSMPISTSFAPPIVMSKYLALGVIDLIQSLRDRLVEEKGVDMANKIMPAERINYLREEAAMAVYPGDAFASRMDIDGIYRNMANLESQMWQVQDRLENQQYQLAAAARAQQAEAEADCGCSYAEDGTPITPTPDFAQPTNSQGTPEFMGKKHSLKKLMADKKINTTGAAMATGIAKERLEEFLAGKAKPTDSEVKKIAETLGVEAGAISMTEEEEAPPTPVTPETSDMNELIFLRQQLAAEASKREAAEREAENYSAQVVAERRKRRMIEITNYTENLKREGRLTPGMLQPVELSFGEGEEAKTKSVGLVDFMVSLTDEQLTYQKQFLESIPKLIDFKEVAPDFNDKPDNTPQAPLNEEQVAKKAREYVLQQKQLGNEINYIEAVDQVMADFGIAA